MAMRVQKADRKPTKERNVKVKPCKESNAISVVAFALEFQREFTPGELRVLLSLHQGDEDELPQSQRHEAFSVNFNPGTQQQFASPKELGGVSFAALLPNGRQRWSFTVQQNTVVVQCTEYTRWAEISEKALGLIARFIPLVADANEAVAVGIEYQDDFLVSDGSAGWERELFQAESVYLPAYIFDLEEFWHVHTGCFSLVPPVNGGESERMLTKVNLNYIHDQKQGLKLVSTTHHRIAFGTPQKDFETFVSGQIRKYIEIIHDENKRVMRALLSKTMLKTIGLED
jgi:uncharacterized protein (TIGR04255 family)